MTMESSLLSIESLVSEVKDEILSDLSNNNVDAFVSASAYDTAWVAMIPDQNDQEIPMFSSCLNWIVRNQKEGGFWGETNEEDLPTIDALTSTLACLIALKNWDVGHQNVELGLRFVESKAEILLKLNYQNLPRWFVLTFPAMIELAEAAGLQLVFPHGLITAIADIFVRRQRILETEELVVEVESEEWRCFPPLLSYLETLPSTYDFDFDFDREVTFNRYLSYDGSLFQSPSATAQAFMSTRNIHSLKYLQSLVQNFPNGVPTKYPVDEELTKLCMVDHVQSLGLAAYFTQQIHQILDQIYRHRNQKNKMSNVTLMPLKLFKDALAFRLLRMHGHDIAPESFCWFLRDQKTMSYMEKNSEQFISAMHSVHRATDLSFPGEDEMAEARIFATKILQNSKTRHKDHNFLITKGLQNVMKYELQVPWTARLDRLYHRKYIEENKISPLWIGKASLYRLSCLDNTKLMQLAVEQFEFMQSIYVQELEELKGWSKKWRLSEMGFGREKTVYTYFAVASCSLFPHDSIMRLVIAKAAIIVTVADDFYDMEGSLLDLEILTLAVQRWDGEGLEGHSKTIFEALDEFVIDVATRCYPQQASKVVLKLQNLWRECFVSWMVERRWSETGYRPTMDEYLERGMSSIAAHTIALPATTFLNPNQNSSEYQNITKLLMATTRLTNDTQSYQKEMVDGKMNLVMLHSHENPEGSIEESKAYVEEILEAKRKEFVQHVLMEDEEMPKSCKQTHLCCMKVFEMFYNSANLFDSETALVEDINKSIFVPIHRKPLKLVAPKLEGQAGPTGTGIPNNLKPKSSLNNNNKLKVSAHFHAFSKSPQTTNFIKNPSVSVPQKLHLATRLNLRFIGLPL